MFKNLRDVDVILDADDITYDWSMGMAMMVKEEHGLVADLSKLDDFGIHLWLGVEKARSRELIKELNSHPVRFANMPVRKGAVEGIQRMAAAGLRLAMVTNCCPVNEDGTLDMRVAENRIEQTERIFGQGTFTHIDCLGMGADKQASLALYRPAVFVDDLAPNLAAGRAAGHDVIMMRARHNPKWRQQFPHIADMEFPLAENWSSLLLHLEGRGLLPPVARVEELAL